MELDDFTALTKTCKVNVRNNYGNIVIYPACKISEILANIAGTKTLTRETIDLAKELGYKFQALSSKI